jgi:hypothetical protein
MAAGHARLAAAVACPHRGDEAEVGGVGQFDGVGLVVEGHGREHRAEDLVAGQLVPPRHRAEQRGRHVVAARVHAVGDAAFGQHRDAGRAGACDEALHARLLRGVDERAAVRSCSGVPARLAANFSATRAMKRS